MFLRLQRFPLGTPLYVRPRDIVAFAAYTDPNAVAVVVKGMDPAEVYLAASRAAHELAVF